MHWISPLARAGLRILAASRLPSAAPAPTMVCISSMNRITLPAFLISDMHFFRRSSNSPRYLLPATMDPMSRDRIRRPVSMSGTRPCTMRSARPSTTALLPTPGSPMSTGLFLVRRIMIWIRRWISVSRPITGSSSPSWAARVRSREYLDSVCMPPGPSLSGSPGCPGPPGPAFAMSPTGPGGSWRSISAACSMARATLMPASFRIWAASPMRSRSSPIHRSSGLTYPSPERWASMTAISSIRLTRGETLTCPGGGVNPGSLLICFSTAALACS